MGRANNFHSLMVSVLRGGRGWRASAGQRQPEKLLELYEFEACPFCRKVREHLSELDLEYLCRTSARGSASRAALKARGGQIQVPFLIDPNTGVEMYESEDIIDYLHKTYGRGVRPTVLRVLSPLNTASAAVASLARMKGRRIQVARSEQPAKLLELFNFEASPFCRKVREHLNELDLHHHVRNVAKSSPRRDELVARGGRMMVPYLIDPNTGTEMYESDDIIDYLNATYAG